MLPINSQASLRIVCFEFAGLRKRLVKLGRKKSCAAINGWISSITNHLHWCAASSHGLPKEVIVEKWKSVTRHVVNVHDHDSALFPHCEHDDLGPAEKRRKKWLKYGITVLHYNKIEKEYYLKGTLRKQSDKRQNSRKILLKAEKKNCKLHA